MDNLSKEEQEKLPQLIKKFKTDKKYFNFIILSKVLYKNGKKAKNKKKSSKK